MPIPPTLQSHDILLTDYAATPVTLGLILERDEKGIPIFKRFPAESLSQQQFQSFSEAIFPPQYQGFITQETWHAGFGQQMGGINGNKRYMQTFGVDCSLKGLMYPSSVVSDMTNSNPTQTGYNMGFETWTDISGTSYLVNWAKLWGTAAQLPAKDTTVVQGGAASARRPAENFELRQPLGVTAVSGSIITVTLYVRAITTDATLTWYLTDASETQLATQVDTGTAGAGWVQKTFTYTFVGTVTNPILRITLGTATDNGAWIDTGVITWTGTALTTLTTGTIVKAVDFNSVTYFVSDTGVWKRSGVDLVWVGGSPPGITDAFVDAAGTYLFLCRGQSLIYWLMNTAEHFIINSGTAKAEHGVAVGGANYINTTDSNVAKMNSLEAGTITTNYTVGTTAENIQKILDHLGLVTIVKDAYAAYINASGTVVEIVSEIRSMFNTNTGKNSISWRGNGAQTLYIPAGAGASMLAYDAGDVVNMGPDMVAERLGDFTGQIVAIAADDQWLYAILDNVLLIEFLKGRYETIDGVTEFRWHSFNAATYGTVGYAYITSLTAKRLYFGGGAVLPKYISLPTNYGDPLNDTNLTFASGPTAHTSWYDLNLARINKSYLNVTIDSTGLSSTKTIKVEYQLWESQGTWTELGGSGNGTFTTSPTETKTFAINISGRKIRFRFTFSTDNTAVGYALLLFNARLALSPPRLDIFTARVRVGSENLLKNKEGKDTEMVYTKVAPQLHTWKSTQPLLLTYPDGQMDAADGSHDGKTIEVKFMEGYPKETFLSLGLYGSTREDPESLFDLALVSIDRSVS